jgi:hypothetical protein
MKQLWQRFVHLTGDPEVAAIGLLAAAFTIVASVAAMAYCLRAGQHLRAVGIGVGLAAVVSVCIRDYRRCRWSVLSGIVAIVWLLLTVAALVYSVWLAYAHG